MAISKRLAAHRASVSIAASDDPDPEYPEDEPEDEQEPASKKKDKKPMTNESETEAAIAKAKADATTAANARFSAVLASAEFAGRETLAQTLLAQEALDADAIIAALAAAPKPAAATTSKGDEGDDDDKARADMRKNLGSEQPGRTADTGDDELEAAAENYGWEKIHQEVAEARG